MRRILWRSALISVALLSAATAGRAATEEEKARAERMKKNLEGRINWVDNHVKYMRKHAERYKDDPKVVNAVNRRVTTLEARKANYKARISSLEVPNFEREEDLRKQEARLNSMDYKADRAFWYYKRANDYRRELEYAEKHWSKYEQPEPRKAYADYAAALRDLDAFLVKRGQNPPDGEARMFPDQERKENSLILARDLARNQLDFERHVIHLRGNLEKYREDPILGPAYREYMKEYEALLATWKNRSEAESRVREANTRKFEAESAVRKAHEQSRAKAEEERRRKEAAKK